ncbi:MAG: RNA 2',3'-cyclic phosphodiesterase [Bacillota bacterium]|nr:RNA 2',3'-cyclic phosphodiesterase [Bacillota bacterium]
MEQLRVFIAVDIPAALQGKLSSVADRLRRLPGDARWVSAPHLHLTLRFLGEIDPAQLPSVSAVVGKVAARHGPFPVTLAGLGLFPERGAPHVVWLGVERGRVELSALQRDLQTELELSGFAPEERPFTPHLTLARLRTADPAAWREAVCRFGRDPVLSFEVRDIRVMNSELTRRGPIYTVLSVAPLGAAAQASAKRGE